MIIKSNKEILDYKKGLFKKEIVKSSISLGVSIPIIKFWKSYDNQRFYKGERANIHFFDNIICISEQELDTINEKEIKETV